MPELIQPTTRLAPSYRDATADFIAEGRGGPNDDSALARNIAEFGDRWHTEAGFAEFVADLRRQADPAVPPPPGWTHTSTYWWAQDENYLGSIRIRHQLIPPVLAEAGLIGYDIAPKARRLGHGTAMLRAALPIARELGFDRVLITCDPDNIGSRRVMENNGGVFEAERNGKLRYWVPTGD
ncbi:MAG: GNAT family N-acetyltransferase [Jatrophihabitantaceae bacterium]